MPMPSTQRKEPDMGLIVTIILITLAVIGLLAVLRRL